MEKTLLFFFVFIICNTALVSAVIYDNPNLPRVERDDADILTFLGLTDTPTTYTGSENYCTVVNAAGTGLEFALCNATSSTNCTTCDTRFLRLDTSNDPLTSDLRILKGSGATVNITFGFGDDGSTGSLVYNKATDAIGTTDTTSFVITNLLASQDAVIIGNTTSDWFFGKFNWTTGDDYNSFDGSTLTFNETALLNSSGYNITAEMGQFSWLSFPDIIEPSTPPANTTYFYVINQDGFSRFNYKDRYGVVRTLNDDEIIVNNSRGSTIAAHRIVYVTGHDSGVPTVDLAKADNISTMPSICVTIESIDNGKLGRCMMSGLLENVNTNAYNVGTIYVSEVTAGIPTNTVPITPNLTQEIGTILVKDVAVGKIQIISRALTGDEFGTINNFIIAGNTSADWATYNNLNVTGTSYLADLIISADNITVNNINSKDGNVTINNATGGEVARFTGDGRVGIGTQIPTPGSSFGAVGSMLEIEGSSNPHLVIHDTGQANEYYLYATSDDFGINYGTTLMLNIQNDGNIGIGENSPSTRFHITDNPSPIVRLENSAVVLTQGQSLGGLEFYNPDNSGAGIGAFIYANTSEADATGGYLTFGTGTGDASERMRILGNGNIGIGTATPTNEFHVLGVSRFEGNLSLENHETISNEVDNIVRIGGNSTAAGHYTWFEVDSNDNAWGATIRGKTTQSSTTELLYIDGSLIAGDDQFIAFGNAQDERISHETTGNDFMLIDTGVDNAAYSGNIVIAGKATYPTFAYPLTAHPVLSLQASTTTLADRLSLWHDGTQGQIKSYDEELLINNTNVEVEGSLGAECYFGVPYRQVMEDNAAPPNQGYLTLSGGVDFAGNYGIYQDTNWTINKFIVGSRIASNCAISPIYDLRVNDVSIITIHGNFTSAGAYLVNTTSPNLPYNISQGDEIQVYVDNGAGGLYVCTTAPDDNIAIASGETRCP